MISKEKIQDCINRLPDALKKEKDLYSVWQHIEKEIVQYDIDKLPVVILQTDEFEKHLAYGETGIMISHVNCLGDPGKDLTPIYFPCVDQVVVLLRRHVHQTDQYYKW